MNAGTLSFALNGKFLGIAFNDIKLKQGPIYPAVAMLHDAGCTITYKPSISNIFPKWLFLLKCKIYHIIAFCLLKYIFPYNN